jgi:hypothetical protein
MVKVLASALMAAMMAFAVSGWVAATVRHVMDNLPIVY